MGIEIVIDGKRYQRCGNMYYVYCTGKNCSHWRAIYSGNTKLMRRIDKAIEG